MYVATHHSILLRQFHFGLKCYISGRFNRSTTLLQRYICIKMIVYHDTHTDENSCFVDHIFVIPLYEFSRRRTTVCIATSF